MLRFKRVVAISVLCVALAWTARAEGEPLRVLFLGNSLTYTNDLPLIVEALSKSGPIRVEASMYAAPNAALEDLWQVPAVRRMLASRGFDVVVMQQGPSALDSSRAELVKWSRILADEIRKAGARPALTTVWPSNDRRRTDLTRVIRSYSDAARSCECDLYAAGSAWQAAWQRESSAPLYGADGFHPSADGSYLAGLVIWGELTGGDVSNAPATLVLRNHNKLTIPEERAALYRSVAAEVVAGK